MAINLAGDLDLLVTSIFITERIIAVLYEHPVNMKALQYMGEAAGLQRQVGGLQYRVLVATERQHTENVKKGLFVLRTNMFTGSPVEVIRFAGALTGGDTAKLFDDLKAIEESLHVKYGQGP